MKLAVVARSVSTCLLIGGLYYLIPVEPGVSGLQRTLRAAGTLLVGLLVIWLIVRRVSRQVADPERTSLAGLLAAVAGGVVFFALADYVTAVSQPGQFVGLQTKTDGLYFALTTLTTVGYGDVHAAGQIARGVVTVQLVVNVVVIATAASVLARQLGERARQRRNAAQPSHPDSSQPPG